ncbi:hypothetical protein [Mahella australiensis]|uniref:Uncharacterized protein n=1 Tax=Mahella australiensis (strain DSM 15567 / CIP 107919 / 50-1 BON) TaxID=697281 RepID=F4A0D6_MAHA5|nr:hypothetical protein [Mahella australiensis]AEE97997.1 hypothetical protein Mahau_2874 [Mahella australiensis 50-1 BON]
MKKKVIIIGIILCLIVSAAIYFSLPAPIINNKDNLQIYRVSIANSKYDYDDVTSQIDCNKLAQLISTYNRSKLPHSFAPHQITVGEIEIDAIADNKVMHIILGDVNVVYESADKGGYTIYNSEQLESEVLQMIQK